MKKICLLATSLALIFFLQTAYGQYKKPPKDPVIVKVGQTPPYNPVPPLIFDDITKGPTMKSFSKLIISADRQNQSNAVLEIISKSTYKKGFSATVNEIQYNFYDNGKYPDKKAGDGIYTSTINEKYHTPVEVNVDPDGNIPSKGKFLIETVPCPKGCKSLIFQTTCTVCLKIKWESD